MRREKRYLFINTINPKLPGLIMFNKNGEIVSYEKFSDKVEGLAKKLDEFFKKNNDARISGVSALTGQGSFTSIRAGITLANAISFIKKIPTISVKDNGLQKNLQKSIELLSRAKKTRLAIPYYDRAPNITV